MKQYKSPQKTSKNNKENKNINNHFAPIPHFHSQEPAIATQDFKYRADDSLNQLNQTGSLCAELMRLNIQMKGMQTKVKDTELKNI